MGLHNEKLHEFFDGFGLPVADVQSMEDAVNAAYQMANPGAGLIRPPVAPGMRLAPYIEYGKFGETVEVLYKNMYGWARTHDENVCLVELNCGFKPATHA